MQRLEGEKQDLVRHVDQQLQDSALQTQRLQQACQDTVQHERGQRDDQVSMPAMYTTWSLSCWIRLVARACCHAGDVCATNKAFAAHFACVNQGCVRLAQQKTVQAKSKPVHTWGLLLTPSAFSSCDILFQVYAADTAQYSLQVRRTQLSSRLHHLVQLFENIPIHDHVTSKK